MAEVEITSTRMSFTIPDLDDAACANIVDKLARQFERTGGAWLSEKSTMSDDEPALPRMRWIPAATTEVIATFDSEVPHEASKHALNVA